MLKLQPRDRRNEQIDVKENVFFVFYIAATTTQYFAFFPQPDNILMADPHGDQIRLCDFGSAVAITPDEAQYCKYGTPEFVAPEIVNQTPVSKATDIWYLSLQPNILFSFVLTKRQTDHSLLTPLSPFPGQLELLHTCGQ